MFGKIQRNRGSNRLEKYKKHLVKNVQKKSPENLKTYIRKSRQVRNRWKILQNPGKECLGRQKEIKVRIVWKYTRNYGKKNLGKMVEKCDKECIDK